MGIPAAPSLSERYQEATNYTPASVQGHPGLDFSSQPSPFKDWFQARRVELPGGPGTETSPSPGALDAERLGRLLYHTYGVTLVREFPGMSMHYRAAPSAGGLYPADLYVAVRDVEGVPDGIFAYDARDHSLVICWEGDFWPDLAACTFAHPSVARARAVLIGTGVYERSAWRYGDRAYRRVLLDAGHVFGNAVLAAVPDGQRLVPLPYFADAGVSGLLLLDEAREGPLLLGAVLDAPDDDAGMRPTRASRSPVDRDSADPDEGHWIPRLHQAGNIQRFTPAETSLLRDEEVRGESMVLPADPLATGQAVLEAIRRRRSTRVFSAGDLPLEAVGRILAHAYPRPGSPDPEAGLAPPVLQTHIAVAGVKGLASGVYRYDPAAHAITLVRPGSPRDALHRCCLWQELARDCAFAVLHSFDLPAAVAAYGERIYRTAHLEAGLIGQRLNMAALRLGYGASGVGGFFDDFLNALLLIPPQHAIAYVTAVGLPE
ncbi:MAG: SagB/ThcOx family dehydrogenase [Planctomycetota bacterium]|nr:SagB/ThcOx family dehydrogenase [Planctomycetota bacterium]